MSAAMGPGRGFEGRGVLEALLVEAGQPRPMEEVDRLLRTALEESLLPSEIVYRVVGKQARGLPAPLVRRLASNLFALYASIGREVFEKTQTQLLARAVKLQSLSQQTRRDFLSRVREISPGAASVDALKNLREAEEALAALSRDLRERPLTRRLCMDAESALSHLSVVIEGAAQVLRDEAPGAA